MPESSAPTLDVPRSAVMTAAVAAALILGLVGWRLGAPLPSSPLGPVAAVPVTSGAELVTVHVSGAVVSPGLVVLSGGARVADAIRGAGGLRPDADPTALNLAATVADGAQVLVPQRGDSTRTPGGGSETVAINRASASELEALPGIGPVMAQRIVAHREENGPFRAVEDLLDVPGIGEAVLASLRDLVTVP